MLENIFGSGDFEPENFPQGYDKTPHCPITGYVNLGVKLAGLNFHPEKFCGNKVKYEDTIGLLSGHKGNTYSPYSACSIVHDKLAEMVSLVSNKTRLPSEEGISSMLAEELIPVEKRVKAGVGYLKLKAQDKERVKILKKWIEVIWSLPSTHSEKETDPDFRNAKKPEDLPEKKVLGRVIQLVELLEKTTGPNDFQSRFYRGAENCKQSPKHRFSGAYSLM